MKLLGTISLSLILALSWISARAEIVGKVLLAAGEAVTVRAGATLPLAQGTPIEDKDTLKTGAASNMQVRFTDGSIMSLRENSELAIEEYHFSGRADGLEKAFYRMIKGGLRTVTGLIGHTKRDSYQVRTVVATIGIRGTHYVLMSCVAGSCANADGSKAKDGLYGGVTDGIVAATTKRGEFRFGAGETFFAQNIDSPVDKLIGPPVFLSDRLEGQKRKEGKQADSGSGGSGSEQTSSGGIQADSRPNTTPLALPTLPFVITQNLGPQGGPSVLPPANGWVVIYPMSNGVENAVFSDQDPATFNGSNQLLSYGIGGAFPSGALGGGTIADSGGLTLATGQVVAWGRWTGGTSVVTSSGATLTNVPLLFGTVSGLVQNGSDLRPAGGVATYTFAGGPRPVDFSGNVGNVTSSSLKLDFTAQSALFSAGINFASIGTFGSATFNVSGTGGRQFGRNNGDFGGSLTGSCTGSGCASSSVTGGFGVGTAGGANEIDFAIVGGGFGPSLGGPVAFLNAYLINGFASGPPAASSQTGELAFAAATPSSFANTTGTGSQALFSGTNLIAFGNGSAGSALSGSLGSGTVIETGSTPLVDGGTMNWGRWSGATTVFPSPNTGATSPPTGVPYVIGDGNTVLPISGTFLYSFAGGPNPVNTSGTVGTFNGGAFNVSFGATSGTLSIATPLSLSVGGVNFSLGTCVSGCSFTNSPAVTSTMNMTGTCANGPCSTGGFPITANATGVFVGPQGAGLAVAGNVFSSFTPTVSFAAGFKR